METKFNKFLNEYGGPGRAVGFRYSEPSIDYKFSINVILNPEIKIKTFINFIKKVFTENNVGEDSMTFNHLGKDEYILTIKMKGYSKFELMAMIDLLFKKIKSKFEDDVYFVMESVQLDGSDIYETEEEQKKPIGFHKSKD